MTSNDDEVDRMREFTQFQLYSEYAQKYEEISNFAVMLQSSISFVATPHSAELRPDEQDVVSDTENMEDDVDYDILNEWYFVVSLVIALLGALYCSAVIWRHYRAVSGWSVFEDVEDARSQCGSTVSRSDCSHWYTQRNIDVHRLSIASISSGNAMDLKTRYSPIRPTEGMTDDESLLTVECLETNEEDELMWNDAAIRIREMQQHTKYDSECL